MNSSSPCLHQARQAAPHGRYVGTFQANELVIGVEPSACVIDAYPGPVSWIGLEPIEHRFVVHRVPAAAWHLDDRGAVLRGHEGPLDLDVGTDVVARVRVIAVEQPAHRVSFSVSSGRSESHHQDPDEGSGSVSWCSPWLD